MVYYKVHLKDTGDCERAAIVFLPAISPDDAMQSAATMFSNMVAQSATESMPALGLLFPRD